MCILNYHMTVMKIERAASTALLGKKNAGLVTLIASELVND